MGAGPGMMLGPAFALDVRLLPVKKPCQQHEGAGDADAEENLEETGGEADVEEAQRDERAEADDGVGKEPQGKQPEPKDELHGKDGKEDQKQDTHVSAPLNGENSP